MDGVLIIIDKAPYGREDAFSGFYVAIACLNRELNADVLLTGDGVYAALEGQKPEKTIRYPSVEDLTYLIFPEGNLFVHRNSMDDRGIYDDDLVESAQSVDDNDLYNILKSKNEGAFIKI